ncbi:MAG: carboxyvinyl-carboxyphosphonatephosphorylmutase [Actinomycetia bacterium]|nr:carboxyvinyl-carboxyphosphonatephosphorylmutase [Actinomycetes bacterium]
MTSLAVTLRGLHVPGSPLVLANAWDAASASMVEEAGYHAVASSSAAVADTEGWPDNNVMPADVAIAAVARVVRGTSLPVTADIEGGYGLPAFELVERLLAAGAVGCNIEDTDHSQVRTLVDRDTHVRRIEEVRAAAGDALVVNARVDAIVRGGTLEEAIERGKAYLAAGADCVYPIFLGDPGDPGDVATFVEAVGGPVNILFRPGAPSLAELASLGVARVSIGSGWYRKVQAAMTDSLETFFG